MSLKMVTLRRVVCDAEGCDTLADVTNADAIGARFEVARLGWAYRSGAGKSNRARFDFCPKHAEVANNV